MYVGAPIRRGETIIGMVSVTLTGIFGILELPPEWVARKEAAVPLIIGIFIIASLKTPFPLVRKLLLTESLFDVERLHQALREKERREQNKKGRKKINKDWKKEKKGDRN